jgi:hypothetical protein
LALGAEVRPALRDHDALDSRLAFETRLSSSLVNPKAVLKSSPTINPIDACAAMAYSGAQSGANALP